MTTIEHMEKAISQLDPAELDRFRSWFSSFDAQRFDEKIEKDAKAGRLERFAEEAIVEFHGGRSREL